MNPERSKRRRLSLSTCSLILNRRPEDRCFPRCRFEMFPRLQRFDVDFDLPDAFLPEFPPAIFLQNRPELGDVSRGEVVSINNYYAPFQRHSYAGAARWTADAAYAVSAGGI